MAGAALTSPGTEARYPEMPQPRSVPLASHRGESQIAELPLTAAQASRGAPPVMLRPRPNPAGRLSAPSPKNSGPATRVRPSACAERREGVPRPAQVLSVPPGPLPPRLPQPGRGSGAAGSPCTCRPLPRCRPAPRRGRAAPHAFPRLFPLSNTCAPGLGQVVLQRQSPHPPGGTGPALTARRSGGAPSGAHQAGGWPAAALPLRKATSVNFTDEQFLCFPSIFSPHKPNPSATGGIKGAQTKLLLHTKHLSLARGERRRVSWASGYHGDTQWP